MYTDLVLHSCIDRKIGSMKKKLNVILHLYQTNFRTFSGPFTTLNYFRAGFGLALLGSGLVWSAHWQLCHLLFNKNSTDDFTTIKMQLCCMYMFLLYKRKHLRRPSRLTTNLESMAIACFQRSSISPVWEFYNELYLCASTSSWPCHQKLLQHRH